jgi:multidrug efflux pump subunit AcrB
VTILQIGLSRNNLSEQDVNDIATNTVRKQLVTVPGAVVPSPHGGKQRQITINMGQNAMQSKGIAPGNIPNAVALQIVVMPSGTIKIGENECDVRANGTPRAVDQIGSLPIKQTPGTTIYLRDLSSVSDSFQVQTNIVRQDGHRGVPVTVPKSGNASTLDVVKGICELLPRVASIAPPSLRMVPLADQSIFVRAAVSGVSVRTIFWSCFSVPLSEVSNVFAPPASARWSNRSRIAASLFPFSRAVLMRFPADSMARPGFFPSTD